MKNLINKFWLLPIFAFLCLGINTHAQVLQSPLDGAAGISVSANQVFDWEDHGFENDGINEDDYYILKIGTSSGTSDEYSSTASSITSSTETVDLSTLGLAYNTVYYWEVEAYDDGTLVMTYSGFTFKTQIEPNKLTIDSQPSGTGVSITPTIDYSYTHVGSASNVYIEVKLNGSTITTHSGVSATTTYNGESLGILSSNTSYTLTIVVTNADNSSDTYTVTGNTFLTQFSLTSPTNGVNGQLILPNFQWQDVSSIVGWQDYTLVISENSDLSSPTVNKSGITSNSYQLLFSDGILKENTTYYWQVTALDAGDNILNTSQKFSFITDNKTEASLTTPLNGQTGESIQPTLKWTDSNANTNRLVISTSTNFNSTNWVFNTTSGTNTGETLAEADKLNNNTTYYWTVFGEDGSGGVQSYPGYFQFKTTPSVSLSLSNPADNSTGVSASYVMFTWYTGSLTSGLKYYLQYDENANTFSSADFSVVTSNTYYTKTNLLENTNYAWRVIAFRDDGDGNFEEDEDVIVSYSASATFRTAGGSTVNAIPSFPTGGAKVYTNTPIFYWYLDSFGSDLSFVVQVDNDNNTGTIEYTLSATTNLYIQMTPALPAGQTCHWRVTPYYKKGTAHEQVGTPSAWAEFETHGSGTLVVPSVSYPTGGVTVYTTSPYLYWYLGESVSGLTYNVEVNDDQTFTNAAEFSASGVSALYTQASGLTPGTTYYWRVQSDNGTSQSGWSNPVGEFVVAGGLNDGHAVASYPTSNPTVYTQNPTVYWYVEGSSLGLDGYWVKYKQATTEPADWSLVASGANSSTEGKYQINSINTTHKQITDNLEYGKKYYWAVAAYDGSNTGTYSSGSFTIVGGSSVIPVLTSPIGGETVSTKSPTLRWYVYGSSTGITQYQVHFSSTGFLSDSSTATTTGTETYYNTSGLTPGATYTWWVRGVYGSSGTYTAWSSRETFVVDPGAAPVQPWVGGPNNVTVATNSPVVSWVLPVQSESQLTYELEVADNPEFTNSTIITSDQPFTQVDGLNLGDEYYWRARSKTVNGGQYSNYSPTAHFKVDATTAVEDGEVIPTEFSVSQNYPNPFNPSTIIEFAMPSNEFVSVKIYDVLGRSVATLVNKEMTAGVHKLTWNGKDDSGAEVSAGAYIYRIVAGNNVVTKKMMLLK